jgi:hypothetical protein
MPVLGFAGAAKFNPQLFWSIRVGNIPKPWLEKPKNMKTNTLKIVQ